MTREDRKYVLGFGAVCGVFGIACGIVVAILASPNESYRFFAVPAGIAAFLTGAFNWWLFIGWKSKLSVRRGILAGLLAGIGGQYICWLLVLWGAWMAAMTGLLAQKDVIDPLNALWGAAAFTAWSLLFMGWITVPGGAMLGGLFAALQKRLEAERLSSS
ncbi:hypothetical protein DSM104443_04088 [Usitatibacter rugosus]|uniref:Uncharacterized protein n=1 Tax=Usitatibacter rugosus TaxID=2732067 RepID=A0A6M4H361_9PROT|nr:hypothetical protein [Usitatibacter rugosus]QJR12994.1 hypothetical protein DSM104443_04088 [Usitatibacter rugosus]